MHSPRCAAFRHTVIVFIVGSDKLVRTPNADENTVLIAAVVQMSSGGAIDTDHVLTVNVNYSDSSTASATIQFDSVSATTPPTTVGQTFAYIRDVVF